MRTAHSTFALRPIDTTQSERVFLSPIAARECGAALVMSLMILLILTMLGVAAMGTSSLQEKMSAGIQESTRTFQIAESGLQRSLTIPGTFDLNKQTTVGPVSFGGYSVTVNTNYLEVSPPKRGSGYSSVDYDGANFNQQSTATGLRGANATINRGVVQIVGKAK